MFKPLLRTMPSLNGNIKIVCNISDYIFNEENNLFEGNVRYATLSPVSSQLYNKYLDISLLNSSYEWDVKKFYKKYSNFFYKKLFEINKEDLPLFDNLSNNKTRNTDFEFGVKRISYLKSGKQFSFFAPIFIENENDIPDYFEILIEIENSIYKTERKIRINIGNNLSGKNYLGRYILDYAQKIDNNVVYLSKENNRALYYGIDVISGGFSKKHDVTVSGIFLNQNTMLNFDSKINSGFERNKLIMKQILPLSFNFSLNDILNKNEQEAFFGSQLSISGKWFKNGKEIRLYDFSHDYVSFNPSIYKMNMIDGYLKPIVPKMNLMNINYPGLKEVEFYKYKYSNKITPNFNRWKLRFSNDENPYIINNSPSFSLYQYSRLKYHQYPTNYEHIPGVVVKKPYYLNLILPLNDGENKYSSSILSRYSNIRNNYASSWFEIFTTFNEVKDYFVDVDDNKAFFNGILYNLQNIYDGTNRNLQKIDKFAVFIKPVFNILSDEDLIDKNIFSEFTIFKERSKYATKPNCHINDDVLTSDNPRIFNRLSTKVKGDELAKNKIFKYNENQNGDFINLADFGINWYDTNDFVNIEELKDKLPETLYEGLVKKSIEGYDIIPVYKLSNILNNEYKLLDEIVNYNNVYVSDFGSSIKYKINDDILSKADIRNKYSIYNKIFYRKHNFIDRQDLLNEIYSTYFTQLQIQYPDKTYNWYNNIAKKLSLTSELYVNDSTSYQYNPILGTSSDTNYAFDVFSESSSSINKHFYGSKINSDKELKDDNNFIWVDTYNLNKIIAHYNDTWLKNDTKLSYYGNNYQNSIKLISETSQTFYCKFLDNLHFRFFERCLSQNQDGTSTTTVLNGVYIRRRYFTDDLTIKDGYVPLQYILWSGIQIAEVFEAIGYDKETNLFYFKHLNYDPTYIHSSKDIGLWYFNNNKKQKFPCGIVDMSIFGDPEDYAIIEEIDGVTKKRYDLTKFKFELVFKKKMIRLDDNLWRLINLEEKYAAPYKDLYLYTIESDQEFNQYLKIKKLVNTKDGCNLHSALTGTAKYRGVLKPLFNLATVQNKEDTMIYTEYSIHNVNAAEYKKNKYYRHNTNNVLCMFDLSTINKNIPITIKRKNYLYTEYYDKYISKYVNRNDFKDNNEYENARQKFINENFLNKFEHTYDIFGLNNVSFNKHSIIKEEHEEVVYHLTYENIPKTVIYNEKEFEITYTDIFNQLSTYNSEGEWKYNDDEIEVTKRIVPPYDIHYVVNSYVKTETYKEELITTYSYSYFDEMGLFDDWNINTFSYNNEMYGFYLINMNLNNSTNTFNVETEDGEYLKYISYINDVNISENPEIASETFKQIIPFIKPNPLNFMMNKSYIMMKPHLVNMPCYFHPEPKGNTYNIVYDNLNYEKVTLERYFDFITPLIQPVSSLSTYNLKYKDVNTSFNTYWFKNDTIYQENSSLQKYTGVRIYDMYDYNSYTIKYNNEWKHFNDNRMYNLEESFSYVFENDLNKNELMLWQTDSKIYEIFKAHLLEYDNSLLDEDKIKWAFTKYQVKHTSEPVEIYDDGNKLYRLELYFTLY